jgi:hypothetical protein
MNADPKHCYEVRQGSVCMIEKLMHRLQGGGGDLRQEGLPAGCEGRQPTDCLLQAVCCQLY